MVVDGKHAKQLKQHHIQCRTNTMTMRFTSLPIR